jgi:hypothetical protein
MSGHKVKLDRFPYFFVVGAQKSGTTSLHNWLVQQPGVVLPRIKETHFFSSEEKYRRGIDWYLKQFPRNRDDTAIGEIAPDYMFSREAPHRMREWIKAPKLVFVFRNPIERAFSHYLMSARNGVEPLSFLDALVREPERMTRNDPISYAHYTYMARSRYVEQVIRYREILPDADFLFIKFDDLVASGEQGFSAYSRICHFIGVRSSPTIADRSEKSNQASTPRWLWLRDTLYGESRVKKVLGKFIANEDVKERLAAWLDNINQRTTNKCALDAVPLIAVDEAKEEIRRLRELTGLELGDWLARMEKWRVV